MRFLRATEVWLFSRNQGRGPIPLKKKGKSFLMGLFRFPLRRYFFSINAKNEPLLWARSSKNAPLDI